MSHKTFHIHGIYSTELRDREEAQELNDEDIDMLHNQISKLMTLQQN